MYEWKNKIVLITGASKGIGAAIIKQVLPEGVQHVFNVDVDVQNGVALQNELNEKFGESKVTFVECDVTNEEKLKSTYELILGNKNNTYVLINNAGIFNDSFEVLRKQIEINLTAVITSSLLGLDLMRKDKGGKGGTIINVSSGAALAPAPHFPIYNATKSGVLTFSNGIGSDLLYKRTDVRVMTICYGITDTSLITLKNLKSFDKEIEKSFDEIFSNYQHQSSESAARALIDTYCLGASASVWLSYSNQPAEDITDAVTKAYEIMTETTLKYK